MDSGELLSYVGLDIRFCINPIDVDDDSIDLGIAGRIAHDIPDLRAIELQLKCTSDHVVRGKSVVYPLKLKNYDDLRLVDLVVPT